MKVIPFPGNRDHDNPRKGCIRHNCDLKITFADDGKFSSDDPKAFTPHLPSGHVKAGSEINAKAVGLNKTIKLSFCDDKDKQTYEYKLSITADCSEC